MNKLRHSARAGFSLVEMIGVLAIIAILAVIILPKVFSTIASSRVTNAAASINTMKTAVTDFSGKFGTLPITNANSRLDDLFFTAGLIEGRFTTKIGTQPTATPPAAATWTRTGGNWVAAGGASQATQSRLICLASNTTAPSTANGANYRLNGTANLPAGARVVSAVIPGVTGAQARELSTIIDGEALTAADNATADTSGKVVYNTPNAQGITNAYIYLVHQ